MKMCALYFLPLLFIAAQAWAGAPNNPGTIEISVTPYYESTGPVVKAGEYGEGLSSKDEKVVVTTIRKMKKEWKKLNFPQMYVAAIRLYDLGYRKESVYWFYSAQYRARLFCMLEEPQKVGGMGDAGFELAQAAASFAQLSGPYFNGYAFGDPEWLAGVITQVKTEGQVLPDAKDLKAAYPGVVFQDQAKWDGINKALNAGLDGLLKALENKDEIKQQRKQQGVDTAFSKLTSKDFTQE
jgi:hypothetical protein